MPQSPKSNIYCLEEALTMWVKKYWLFSSTSTFHSLQFASKLNSKRGIFHFLGPHRKPLFSTTENERKNEGDLGSSANGKSHFKHIYSETNAGVTLWSNNRVALALEIWSYCRLIQVSQKPHLQPLPR